MIQSEDITVQQSSLLDISISLTYNQNIQTLMEDTMLEVSLAEKLIEQITKYTDYNVNIMNGEGIIIASRNPDRIGTYHEPAWQILHGKEDIITVNSDSDYPGVSRGINMAIEIDGRREGVVGVTGDPEEIHPIALIIKMSIETMIRYENQKMRILRRQTKEERLLEIILTDKAPAPDKLRELMKELGYRTDIPRAAILCHTVNSNRQAVISLMKSCPLYRKDDILLLPGEDYILLFKSGISGLSNGQSPSPLKEQQLLTVEYMQWIIDHLSPANTVCSFYAGTLQNNPLQYHAAYMHCKWLEKHTDNPGRIVLFYDYIGEYTAQCIPFRKLQQIYGVYGDNMPEEIRTRYLEIAGSLLDSDFNIAVAAKKTYMHKNTFTYQYNKLCELLGINPRTASQDKWFMTFLYYYLKRSAAPESEKQHK